MNITVALTPDRQAALTALLAEHNKKADPPATEQAYLAHVLHSSLDAHADSIVDATMQRIRAKLLAKANRVSSAETIFSKA